MLVDFMAAIDMTADAVPVLLIGDERVLAPLRDVVSAMGGRTLAAWNWDAVATGAPPPGIRPVLMIEAQGAANAMLANTLPALDAIARASDLPVVISLSEASIDIVAVTMFGPHAQLLCDPSAAEQTLALALAAASLAHPGLNDRSYDNEAARLQRLNAEVARIAEALARISDREAGSYRRHTAEVSDRRHAYGEQPADEVVIEPAEIRKALRGRRLREQYFGKGIFEEPGWDIVLDLFAAELEGARVSVSSLCIAAAVAPTTALRWVSKLTEAGLLERQPDPFDRRRAYIELSEQASQSMRSYMAAMRRAGLSLA